MMNWQRKIRSAVARGLGSGQASHHEPDGGLALLRNKPGLDAVGKAIAELPLPQQLVYPLLDYARQPVKPVVSVGASLKLGDRLAFGILATANGTVTAIEPRQIIHPSYREALCVVMDVDTVTHENRQSLPAIDVLNAGRLECACVSGLGGAGFSTASKLENARKCQQGIDTLLVNAVECEPLISCDEALIRSDAKAVVNAITSMIELSACQRCILAIEEDKIKAIAALESAIGTVTPCSRVPIELVQLSAIYPSGAEKVLVQRVTGKAVEAGSRASDRGVLCLNVATIVAAGQAQSGYPLISRIVTVAGSEAVNPVNVRVRIGTSIEEVLRLTGNMPQTSSTRVRAGGPLSGFDLQDLSVPITATTNCIGIETTPPETKALACIRCSQCSDVCPVNLVPQQLFWHASSNDLDGAVRFGLESCIECGCCDIVCPSHIALTSTFRHTRSAWREHEFQKHEAELARERHEQRETRLATREQRAQRIREEKKSQLSSDHDPIAAALARSRARKKKS